MSDAWNNRYQSARITAADVRTGDIIAGLGRTSRSFLSSYAFREVQEVEQLPAGEIRILYRAWSGQLIRRDFPKDQRFYRLPEMPERLPLPDEDPEEMPREEYEKIQRARDTYAYLTAEAVAAKDPIKTARDYAEKYTAAQAQLNQEQRNDEIRRDRETAALEAAGGTDRAEELKHRVYLTD